MLQINVLPEINKAIITYPKIARIPNKEIPAFSKDQAAAKWERETRTYMITTLRRWTIHRNRAFKAKGVLTAQRAHAVDRILLLLSHHAESQLKVLCRRIVQDGECFAMLFPSKQSREFANFRDRIIPVFQFADEYRRLFDHGNTVGIKTV